jgi:TatD DNase family protein
MLIDSHAHIQLKNFDNDREAMLVRAQKAGVGYIIAIGFDLETSTGAIRLAEQYDFVYATVGMHPHDAKLLNDEIIARFREIAQHPKVIAVGEMGLDYYRNLSPRSIQQKAFEAQLRLAQELNLPIIVHDRDAHEDIMEILRQYAGKMERDFSEVRSNLPDEWKDGRMEGKGERRISVEVAREAKQSHKSALQKGENRRRREYRRGVLHCFSGDIDMAKEAIDLGFYISIAGPVTYPKSLSLQKVAREVPMNSLLLETDCPWLAPACRVAGRGAGSPQFRRGKRNEPAYIKVIAEKIAELRGVSITTIADATTANVKTLFGI